jgi:hypothetical protein
MSAMLRDELRLDVVLVLQLPELIVKRLFMFLLLLLTFYFLMLAEFLEGTEN